MAPTCVPALSYSSGFACRMLLFLLFFNNNAQLCCARSLLSSLSPSLAGAWLRVRRPLILPTILHEMSVVRRRRQFGRGLGRAADAAGREDELSREWEQAGAEPEGSQEKLVGGAGRRLASKTTSASGPASGGRRLHGGCRRRRKRARSEGRRSRQEAAEAPRVLCAGLATRPALRRYRQIGLRRGQPSAVRPLGDGRGALRRRGAGARPAGSAGAGSRASGGLQKSPG